MLDILFLWVTLDSKHQIIRPLHAGRTSCVTNLIVREVVESESTRPLTKFRPQPSRSRHALELYKQGASVCKTAMAQGVLQTTVTMVLKWNQWFLGKGQEQANGMKVPTAIAFTVYHPFKRTVCPLA